MYTRIFKFFSNNNLFCPLQFGFRQTYSAGHALFSLTETIRKYLDEGKLWHQHDILLTKLELCC